MTTTAPTTVDTPAAFEPTSDPAERDRQPGDRVQIMDRDRDAERYEYATVVRAETRPDGTLNGRPGYVIQYEHGYGEVWRPAYYVLDPPAAETTARLAVRRLIADHQLPEPAHTVWSPSRDLDVAGQATRSDDIIALLMDSDADVDRWAAALGVPAAEDWHSWVTTADAGRPAGTWSVNRNYRFSLQHGDVWLTVKHVEYRTVGRPRRPRARRSPRRPND